LIDAEISKVETKISGIALGETAAMWQCQSDDPREISDFLTLFPGNLLAAVSGFRQTSLCALTARFSVGVPGGSPGFQPPVDCQNLI